MSEAELPPKELQKTLVVAGVAFVVLVSATYLSYRHTKSRTPQIILPGGITYLGPNTSQKSQESKVKNSAGMEKGKITVSSETTWATWKGKKFPYSFSYPATLSLGFFPDDPFDAVTIFWQNTNPSENLLLRVEDLSQNPDMKQYATKPKRDYVKNWWKQFTFTGVASVEEFTTSAGYKSYRARYNDQSGTVPYEQVFLEVPNKPNLVIWMSQKLLDQPIFNRIVDSVSWGK